MLRLCKRLWEAEAEYFSTGNKDKEQRIQRVEGDDQESLLRTAEQAAATVKTPTARAAQLECDVFRGQGCNLNSSSCCLLSMPVEVFLSQRSGRESSGFNRIASAGEVELDCQQLNISIFDL